MKIKQIFKTAYQVITVAVTVIEAVGLSKSLYGKYKTKNAPATPTAEAAPNVETAM